MMILATRGCADVQWQIAHLHLQITYDVHGPFAAAPMQNIISKKLIVAVRARPKPFEIRDSRLKGFLLRVQPTGVMTYYVEFARGRRVAIGRVGVIEPEDTRDLAKGSWPKSTRETTLLRRLEGPTRRPSVPSSTKCMPRGRDQT
jgi:hypothetical protein